ncbi:MAG: prepilin-type N-terminal cleavage/methylation domain-containing protein [Cellvibrio sp.]|uniref:prepilin-type N-terminal cleavage/methylation domain-containing protein n=1 Tax=Cellvibrio sp. TaxID=1965322 RepID=UPI00271F1B68|nr:prepilin-type N-terminal cleavage/methylation domain-containing protein [Cellvibrio sp.]
MNIFAQRINGILPNNGKPAAGFTLIELIVVIVLLSVLASIGTGFIVSTTEAYQRTQTRALLVNTSRQALERMTRQLRIALPYSVRVTNGGNCLEFMPIAAGGNYFSPVPDDENLAAAAQTIDASPISIDFGAALHVTIGAMSAAEIYGATAASREGYASGNITLSAAKRWRRNSINRRYYLLDNPQAFCVVGNELRFYDGIGIADANVNVAGAHSIIARNINSTAPFALASGSANRNTAITISLDFSSGGETINYSQQVLIRNVP